MEPRHRHRLAGLVVAAALGTAAGVAAAQACELATPRFVALADRIHDKATGLTWSRCNLPRKFDAASGQCTGAAYATDELDAALGAMPALSRQAGTPWRLPTVSELRAVFAVSCTRSQQSQSPFGALDGTPLWSGSTDAGGKAWKLDREGNDGRPAFYAEETGAATILGVQEGSR